MSRSSALRLLVFILLILTAIGCALFLFGTKQGHDLRHHPHKLKSWVQDNRVLVSDLSHAQPKLSSRRDRKPA